MSKHKVTGSYAMLALSPDAFAEIKGKLEACGYKHLFFTEVRGRVAIAMQGIALVEAAGAETSNSKLQTSEKLKASTSKPENRQSPIADRR